MAKKKIKVRKLTQTERNKVMPPGTEVSVFGSIEKPYRFATGVIEKPIYIKDRVKGYQIAIPMPDGNTLVDWVELKDIQIDASQIPEDLEIKSLIPPMELEQRKLYDAEQYSRAVGQGIASGSALLSDSTLFAGEVDLKAALRGQERLEKKLEEMERDEERRERKRREREEKKRVKEEKDQDITAERPPMVSRPSSVKGPGPRAALPPASGKPPMNVSFMAQVEPVEARKKNPQPSSAQEAFLLKAIETSKPSREQWFATAPNLIQATNLLGAIEHAMSPGDAARIRNGLMDCWRNMSFNAPAFKTAVSGALARTHNPESVDIGPDSLDPLLGGHAEPFAVRPQIVMSGGLREPNPSIQVADFDRLFVDSFLPTTTIMASDGTIFKSLVFKLLSWAKGLQDVQDPAQRREMARSVAGASLQEFARKATAESLKDWMLKTRADVNKSKTSAKKAPTYAVFPLPYLQTSTMAKMLPIYPMYFVLWCSLVIKNLDKLKPPFQKEVLPGQGMKEILADLSAGVMRAVVAEFSRYNVSTSPEFGAQIRQNRTILEADESKMVKGFTDDLEAQLRSVFDGTQYRPDSEIGFFTAALRFKSQRPVAYLYTVSFIAHLGMTGGIIRGMTFTNLRKSEFALGGFTLLRLVIESWYRILDDEKTARYYLETFTFTSYPYQLQSALFLATRGVLADKGKDQGPIVWLDIPKSISAMKNSILLALARVVEVLEVVPYKKSYEIRLRAAGQTLKASAPSRKTDNLPALDMFKQIMMKFKTGASLAGKQLEIDPQSLELYDTEENRALQWGPGNSLLRATGLVLGGASVKDPLTTIKTLMEAMRPIIRSLEAIKPLKELAAYAYFSNFEHLQRFLLLNMEAQRLVNVAIQKADKSAVERRKGFLDNIRAFFFGESTTEAPKPQPQEEEDSTVDESDDRGRPDESEDIEQQQIESIEIETEDPEEADEREEPLPETKIEAELFEKVESPREAPPPSEEMVEEKLSEEIFRVPSSQKIGDVASADSVYVSVPPTGLGIYEQISGPTRFVQKGDELLAQALNYKPRNKSSFRELIGSRNLLWSAILTTPYEDLGLIAHVVGGMPVLRELSPGAWDRLKRDYLSKPGWYVMALEPDTFSNEGYYLSSSGGAVLDALQEGAPINMASKHGVMIRSVDDPLIPEEGEWDEKDRDKILSAVRSLSSAATKEKVAEQTPTPQTLEEKQESLSIAESDLLQGAKQGPQELPRVPREERLDLPSFDTKVYTQDVLQGRRQGSLTQEGVKTKQMRADVSMEAWREQPIDNVLRVLNNPAIFTRNTLGAIYRYVLGGCHVTPTQIRKGSYPRKELIRLIDQVLMGRVNQQGQRVGGAPPEEASAIAKDRWPELQKTWSKRVSVGATIMGVPDLIGVPDKGCETPEVFVSEPASPEEAPIQQPQPSEDFVGVDPEFSVVRKGNPGKKWKTWDETDYPYLSLDQIKIALKTPTPARLREQRDFLHAYEKAKGVARELAWVAAQDGKIKDHWWEKREKAIKAILDKLDKKKRGGTQVKWWTDSRIPGVDEQPSSDHISLIAWGYTPHARKFATWIGENKKKVEEHYDKTGNGPLSTVFREENPSTLDAPYYPFPSRPRREENPTKGEWEKWSDTEFPYLTLEQIDAVEILGKLEGVSEVARSDKGFMGAYRQAHGKPHKLDEVSIKQGKGYKSYWWNRREGFNKRHYAQVKEDKEDLWMDGSKYGLEKMPTRRHLGFIFWAWSPVRDEYLSWLRKHRDDLKRLEREKNPAEMPDVWPTYYQPFPEDPFLMPPTVVVNAMRKMRYISRDHGWPLSVLHEAFKRGWREWNHLRANAPEQLEEPEPHLYGLRRMRAINGHKPDPRDLDLYKQGLEFIARHGEPGS